VSHSTRAYPQAANPVLNRVITTDTRSLDASDVRIPVKDGEMPGYLAHPKEGNRFPVIVVIQEIFGVHEHIRDVCRRLAKLGYLAIAPELFWRFGDVTLMKDMSEIMANVVSKVSDAQVMGDLDATVAFAATQATADIEHLAITGFCWGGRITWLYCARNPRVKAGIAWYGRLAGAASELQPRHPLDIAAELKVPVLGLYGGKDGSIPLESVDRMRERLATGTSGSEIHVYADASHAFFADYRANYRKEDAEDGWKQLQSWLNRHGLHGIEQGIHRA
jgi:carboxymethylenebutenolidase